MDKFSKGILYILTVPENANDLYALPQPVLTQLKQYLMVRFPVTMDAPAKVSLFVYDNNTFVVESYLEAPTEVTVGTLGPATRIRNIATGETIEGAPAAKSRRGQVEQRTTFKIQVQPHSFAAFAEE
jgi:hypothetical protein